MKEFKINSIISYGRLKFWKSPKNPKFGTFYIGSFWKCDIEKVIFPEFYRASFGFLIKKFFNVFLIFQKSVFWNLKKSNILRYGKKRAMLPPYVGKSYIYFSLSLSLSLSLYIYIYVYIYIERERERAREIFGCFADVRGWNSALFAIAQPDFWKINKKIKKIFIKKPKLAR